MASYTRRTAFPRPTTVAKTRATVTPPNYFSGFKNKLVGRPENPFYRANLTAVGVPEPMYIRPCVFEPQFKLSGKTTCPNPGISVELVIFLAQVLNFTVKFVRAESIDDMFFSLQNRSADLTLGVVQLTSEYTDKARYTSIPIDGYKYRLIYKTPEPANLQFLLLVPFGNRLWLAMLGTAILCALTWLFMGFVRFSALKHYDHTGVKHKFVDHMTASSILFLVIGLGSWLFLSFYPNVLTIVLSNRGTITKPIHNITDLALGLLDNKFSLILPTRADEVYNNVACPDYDAGLEVYKLLHRACKSNPPIIEEEENRLIGRLGRDPKLVSIISYTVTEAMKARYTGFEVVETGLPYQFRTFYFAPNTTFDIPVWVTEILTQKYVMLVQSYMQDKIDALRNETKDAKITAADALKPLTLAQMQGGFWLLLGGILAASIIAWLELFHWWLMLMWHQRQNEQKGSKRLKKESQLLQGMWLLVKPIVSFEKHTHRNSDL